MYSSWPKSTRRGLDQIHQPSLPEALRNLRASQTLDALLYAMVHGQEGSNNQLLVRNAGNFWSMHRAHASLQQRGNR